jgi:hypothetical protein
VRRGAACAAAAHSNTVRRPSGVVVLRMSGCPPYLGRPVRSPERPHVQRPPVQCPASDVQCPVPGDRCPMSDVQCPVSDVRCPMSDVQCPVPDARCPVRASGIRVHFVRTVELVDRLVRQAATRLRNRLGRVTT